MIGNRRIELRQSCCIFIAKHTRALPVKAAVNERDRPAHVIFASSLELILLPTCEPLDVNSSHSWHLMLFILRLCLSREKENSISQVEFVHVVAPVILKVASPVRFSSTSVAEADHLVITVLAMNELFAAPVFSIT